MLTQHPPTRPQRGATHVPGTARATRSAADVNPYTRWVHEHPDVLLAEPTPAGLRARLAGHEGPLVLDLGCGSGNFLLGLARREPAGSGARFVGFELRYKRLVKAARKAERAGLRNVWFLREEAQRIADYFAPGTLHAVHINFPDPWPRRSDWRKRLVSRALLRALARLLAPGGRVCLRTDHSGYFLHALAVLPEAPDLRLAAYSNGLTEPVHECLHAHEPVRSEFEQLFRAQRKPVYALVLERTVLERTVLERALPEDPELGATVLQSSVLHNPVPQNPVLRTQVPQNPVSEAPLLERATGPRGSGRA